MNRIDREKKTVAAMIRIYCRDHHQAETGLCESCSELNTYAFLRLDKCPYGINKPTCNNCQTHCYKPEKRESIRQVMRYAGPRMLTSHPVLSLYHLWYEYIK